MSLLTLAAVASDAQALTGQSVYERREIIVADFDSDLIGNGSHATLKSLLFQKWPSGSRIITQ